MMIGVFDSGIGGLSILRALQVALPREAFVYYADSAHNPYGDKSQEEVTGRSLAVTQELIEQHQIKALVVACNTATAAAIHVLRERYPQLPIVGIEPALKPAVALSTTKRIAVLATRATLASAKFLALKASLEAQASFTCIACTGLADLIEGYAIGAVTRPEVEQTCRQFLAQAGDYDTLVLGCTHYALIADDFRRWARPNIRIVDNGAAVAKRLAELVQLMPRVTSKPSLELIGSGDQQLLKEAAQRWHI